MIDKIDFNPDMIVEVLNSGVFLGRELKKGNQKFEKAYYTSVKVQRANEYMKRSLIFRMVLKGLPYGILNYLRRYESKKAVKSLLRIEKDMPSVKSLVIPVNSSQKIKNVLIIDDAIDTGKTMLLVKDNLKLQFPEANIKTAVLSWTLGNSIVKPDYYIFKNVLVRFPWSKDYKGEDFE
nr:phosphoribosyltransferase family protein [Aestuariivivens sediminis]